MANEGSAIFLFLRHPGHGSPEKTITPPKAGESLTKFQCLTLASHCQELNSLRSPTRLLIA
jgi:hypothetical protein